MDTLGWLWCADSVRFSVGTTALSPVGFVAPEKQPETLALLNPHLRDFAVRFVAAGHKYLIGGVPTRGSVTGMVHHFAQDFVEEEVIQAMQESAYCHDLRTCARMSSQASCLFWLVWSQTLCWNSCSARETRNGCAK